MTADGVTPPPARSPGDAGAPAPASAGRLTDGQRALWFLHELEPSSSKYIIARAALIRGPLDLEVLERAMRTIGDRHPALRTIFDASAGAPRRIVHARSDIAVERQDASGWTESALRDRLRAAAYRPFDLQRGPLWRVVVFARGAHDHVLLFAMHHIATDFWSLTLVFDEVRRLYEAGVAGGPAGLADALAALPRAGDPDTYLRTVDDYLTSPARDADLAWWRDQLAGAPSELDWPHAGIGPAATDAIPQLEFMLAPELRDRVEAFARARDVTIHAVLIAAYYVVLARWTGQRDLVVGVPSAVRRAPEARRLVGYCVNPLPLRARLSDETSFTDLVARASATTRSALFHQRLPFVTLVEQLCAQRTTAGNPIFQAMFSFQRAFDRQLEGLGEFAIGVGVTELRFGPATIQAYPLAPGAPQVDLTLSVAPVATGLACTLDYSAARFERRAVEQMAAQYERLLGHLLDAPELPVVRCAMLSDRERAALASAWNDTARDYPVTACLHDLVSAQARAQPDAIAVIDARGRLSYAELDARADRLSARLRALGVGLETPVGILMNRSTDLIVAMLAVLKSGGVYVPLDPAYPPRRLELIARDSRIPVLVTERELASRLSVPDCERVMIDDGALLDRAVPVSGPPVRVAPDNAAYLLYTSGSTGNPKGISVTHRNAVSFVHWAATAFSREDMSEVLASTSLCFDLSVFEIYGTLHRGGRVVVVDNALAVADQPHARAVTLINTVPSALSALIATRGVPDSAQVIALAGEALHGSLVRRAYAETRARRVFNYYGPTEATTYATGAELPRDDAAAPAIGLPLDNARAYVLDHELEPLPPGMRGELFIGGDGVTRGYARRPALTAERFVPDPFAGVPGARMYRTGDVVVRRGDGQLHFLGRADHQIKLRGFRIELGEIEAQLASHPAVRDAAATLWTGDGEPRLVAYIVVANELTGEPTDDALRSHLGEALPGYMVPAQLVRCAALPHTPNGKVDRARLPAPGAPPGPADGCVAPRDELEARIAAIWSELLGRDPVGVHDNFFALGGSSLVAARLVSLLHGRGLPVALRDLFEHPTVASLAARLRAGDGVRADDCIPVQPRERFQVARQAAHSTPVPQAKEP
jgi:amino acid adenylation domain-containing protein